MSDLLEPFESDDGAIRIEPYPKQDALNRLFEQSATLIAMKGLDPDGPEAFSAFMETLKIAAGLGATKEDIDTWSMESGGA